MFCYDKKFPKGLLLDITCIIIISIVIIIVCTIPDLLLRLFSYWYDMDVIEEEAFIKWKEDLSQPYPGKGQALFQVSISPIFYVIFGLIISMYMYVGR